MYFYLKKGKQVLDLRGDLVLSHNPQLTRARVKSAAPRAVKNARYIDRIPSMTTLGKVRASWHALRFIWARQSQALTRETIDREAL